MADAMAGSAHRRSAVITQKLLTAVEIAPASKV